MNGTKRPDSDKLAAAMAWIITGSAEEASKSCEIPGRTIRTWMEKDDWADYVAEARRLKQDELDAKLTRVIHEATKVIIEGLEKGDEVMDKQGNILRRKVAAKDAAFIASILSDKRTLLRGEPTKITSSQKGSKDALEEIKKGLEKIGNKEVELKALKPENVDDEHLH